MRIQFCRVSVLVCELPQKVMRTEGGIKVDLHDTEEGIFDFDRQCGSHGLFLVVFVFVYVLLYAYSQNVIGWLPPASNPHFLHQLAPLNPLERKEICISPIVEQELTDDIVRVSRLAFVSPARP